MYLSFRTIAIIIGCVIMSFLLIIYFYLRSITRFWKIRSVEHLTPLLLFGNFWNALVCQMNFVIHVKCLYDEIRGPIGGIFLFTQPVLMVRDPEIIKRILQSDADKYSGCGLLTNNLLMFKGDKWAGVQQLIPISFRNNMVKRKFDIIKKRCVTLQDYIEKEIRSNDLLDVQDLMHLFITGTTASIVFSIEIDSLRKPDDPLCKIGRLIVSSTRNGQLKSLLKIALPSIMDHFKISPIEPELKQMFRKVAEHTLLPRDLKKNVNYDYMQILAQMRNCGQLSHDGKWTNINRNNHHLTIDEVVAKSFLFYIYLFDTASATALYALLELAHNKDIQRKLQTEIDQVLKTNSAMTNDLIHGMKYLDQVVNETLRKYPPMPLIVRYVAKPLKISNTNVVLDKNQLVMIPTYAIHHDTKYYSGPEEFIPDRFTSGEIAKRPIGTFHPYGNNNNSDGMGWLRIHFTSLQIKMCIVAICSKYDLAQPPDHNPEFPVQNYTLSFKKRKKK